MSTVPSSDSPVYKTCRKCNERKVITDFARDRGRPDGYRSRCKKCHSAQNNRYNKRIVREEPHRAQQWRKSFYENHKEEWHARTREYARQHPEIDRAKVRRRRAERYGVSVIDLTREQWDAQREYFNDRCAYCHEPLTQDGQDHIVPVSRGGNHTLSNVVPACRSCNAAKRDRSLVECLMKGFL